MFCMGNPNKVMPDEIFPLYVDKFAEAEADTGTMIPQAEVDEMQGLINAENARLEALREAQSNPDAER